MCKLNNNGKTGIIMIESSIHISITISFWDFITKMVKEYQYDGVKYNIYGNYNINNISHIKILANNDHNMYKQYIYKQCNLTWDNNTLSVDNPDTMSLIKKIKFSNVDNIDKSSDIQIYDLYDIKDYDGEKDTIANIINKAKTNIVIILVNKIDYGICPALSPHIRYQMTLNKPHLGSMDLSMVIGYKLYKKCKNFKNITIGEYSLKYAKKQTYIVSHPLNDIFFDNEHDLFYDMDKYITTDYNKEINIEI